MTVATPAWLAQHGGAVRAAGDGKWLVVFDDRPQYYLTPLPVEGRFGCAVVQTVNGRQVASRGTAPTAEGAVAVGLEDLRQELGW
jgi:hypothetical protein